MKGFSPPWGKGLISAWLVWHLFAILLTPNSETYLGAKVRGAVEPYVGILGLASSWNYFAPDPGPPPIYLEYELSDRTGESFKRGYWPEIQDPYFFRERQNRRIAAVNFAMKDDTRIDVMMSSYFCGMNARTRSVRVWKVAHTIPGVNDVATGARRIGDDAGLERRFVTQTFCMGRNEKNE